MDYEDRPSCGCDGDRACYTAPRRGVSTDLECFVTNCFGCFFCCMTTSRKDFDMYKCICCTCYCCRDQVECPTNDCWFCCHGECCCDYAIVEKTSSGRSSSSSKKAKKAKKDYVLVENNCCVLIRDIGATNCCDRTCYCCQYPHVYEDDIKAHNSERTIQTSYKSSRKGSIEPDA